MNVGDEIDQLRQDIQALVSHGADAVAMELAATDRLYLMQLDPINEAACPLTLRVEQDYAFVGLPFGAPLEFVFSESTWASARQSVLGCIAAVVRGNVTIETTSCWIGRDRITTRLTTDAGEESVTSGPLLPCIARTRSARQFEPYARRRRNEECESE
jgi:hypothetical protein